MDVLGGEGREFTSSKADVGGDPDVVAVDAPVDAIRAGEGVGVSGAECRRKKGPDARGRAAGVKPGRHEVPSGTKT